VEDPNESSRFPILYRAAQLLGTIFDLDDLLKQILDIIFEALPAVRRGYVITFSDNANEAKVRASNLREGEATTLPLSTTLIDYVFTEKNAILTRDAQADSRFQGAQSIIGHAIHAAMCAPLRGRQAVVGAIYVDSGAKSSNFTDNDLQLLTVLAQVVGVAVENARLYQANMEQERLAAIGQATAGIGHCVKNILTGLLGGAQFVDMALEKNDLRYIEKGWPIIRRAIDRIEMLMLNMLSFSRNRQPERALTDVNALIHEVLDVVRSRAEKKNIVLGANQTGIVHAYIDSREIYRVILNLLVNAIDACEGDGGSVTVAASTEPSGCYIEVRDTGAGIPAELMPKLFQAFVSTKGSNGTGLGLACSNKIVREHGGVIHVDSEVGKGTKITVFLPVDQNAPTFMTPSLGE
jgi:signal transduction histidine kinase